MSQPYPYQGYPSGHSSNPYYPSYGNGDSLSQQQLQTPYFGGGRINPMGGGGICSNSNQNVGAPSLNLNFYVMHDNTPSYVSDGGYQMHNANRSNMSYPMPLGVPTMDNHSPYSSGGMMSYGNYHHQNQNPHNMLPPPPPLPTANYPFDSNFTYDCCQGQGQSGPFMPFPQVQVRPFQTTTCVPPPSYPSSYHPSLNIAGVPAPQRQSVPNKVKPEPSFEEDYSEKLIAFARFNRNNSLIQQVLSDTIMPHPGQVVSSKRLATLKEQVHALEEHHKKMETDLNAAEQACIKRKQDFMESTNSFNSKYESLCRPVVDAKVYTEMFLRNYNALKKEKEAERREQELEQTLKWVETQQQEQEQVPQRAENQDETDETTQQTAASDETQQIDMTNMRLAEILGMPPKETNNPSPNDTDFQPPPPDIESEEARERNETIMEIVAYLSDSSLAFQ